MWQTLSVILILLGVSIYLVRYFLRAYRTEGSPCGACAGCGSRSPTHLRDPGGVEPTSLNLTCRDGYSHDHEICS